MTDTNIYFGIPGSLVTLPHPRGGQSATRDRPTQTFPLGNGEDRTRRTLHGSRTYVLDWERLDLDTFSTIEAFNQGHMGPGPFAYLDPGQRNQLLVNQAASTSLSNDTSNFSIAGSGCSIASSFTLATGVPRSLAWTFNIANPASGSAILTLDSPYTGWPGVPVVNRAMCFSCLARGGGADAIVSFLLELRWYDTGANLLSTSQGSTLTTSAGAWATGLVTASAPANAAYVLPRVHYLSGASAGAVAYFSSFQLEEGSTRGTWRPGTGVLPVTVVGNEDQWPWLYATEVRERPRLTLRQDGG
ncbi:MAG TPA: hypothetical protein VF516_00220 [Kofleriaceae bacterium]